MTLIKQRIAITKPFQKLDDISLTSDDLIFILEKYNHSKGTVEQKITADGSSKVLFGAGDIRIVEDDSTDLASKTVLAAGTYILKITNIGAVGADVFEVSLKTYVANTVINPIIGSITIGANNLTVDVTFNEPVLTALDALPTETDFVATLSAGDASDPVIDTPSYPTSNSVRFNLSFTGSPAGIEQLTLAVAGSERLFNWAELPMAAGSSGSALLESGP
jgi:hypothetical protein